MRLHDYTKTVILSACIFGSIAVAACEGKLDTNSQTATTAISPFLGRRYWATTRDGQVAFAVPQVLLDPGGIRWIIEGVADLPAMQDGISAVSWVDSLGRHERAYYVNVDGVLRARAFDADSPSWLTIDSLGASLSGPLYAVNLGLGNVWVGATGQFPGGPLSLGIFDRDPFYPDTYSISFPDPPPEDIAIASIVTGTVRSSQPCFFLQTESGKVAAFSLLSGGWTISALPAPSAFTDAATAVAYGPESVISLFVRATGGSVWQATWENHCIGQPIWQDLGKPDVPISNLKYALSATAYRHDFLERDIIELFAAGSDAKLYRRVFNGMDWQSSWELVAAPADTAGHAIGGLTAVPPHDSTSPFADSSVFFVGEVSRRPSLVNPPAAYAFERSSGRLRDHTDPVVGLRTVNFNRPNGWTESFLAEQDGRVAVAGMEIGPETTPFHTRVGLALSEDDGHTWSTQLLDPRYPPPPTFDDVLVQGDPTTAVDAEKTAWVFLHEIEARFILGCFRGPAIVRSKLVLGHIPSGSVVPAFEDVAEWDDYHDKTIPLGDAEAGLLDGPKMVITPDGTQHFVWWKACFGTFQACPTDGYTVFLSKTPS